MARRSIPTTDPRVLELGRRTRELACDLAGPDATFEEVELFVDAIRSEVVARVLREERAASAPKAPPDRPARAKPRTR